MSNKEDRPTPFDMAFQRLEAVIAERDHFYALYEKVLSDAQEITKERDAFEEQWYHDTENTIPSLRSDLARAQEEIEGLRNFACDVLKDFPESFPDGFDLQDLAIKHGLLVGETVTKPCRDEGCRCAEYHGEKEMSEGVMCYRRAPIIAGAQP